MQYEIHRQMWNFTPEKGETQTSVELLRERAEAARALFNPEQQEIFDTIIDAVINQRPLCIFIDGKAGRGKTFLVNAICNYIRSMGKIVIPTASSAYAAQLYPGGRTTHSAFKVPVNEFSEMLQSTISPLSSRADLLREASLIIWDETPMANGAVLGCCDDIMRQLRNPDLPFGGAPLVLLGDWRQTCPVVRRGTRAQVVAASIKMSPLWRHFTTYHLITPIRNAEDLDYADFVDAIGDGAGPEIDLEPFLPITTKPDELIDFVYPLVVLQDPAACLTRSILAPTNLQVDTYNAILLDRLEGVQRTFLAADSLKEAEDAGVEGEDGILDYVARRTPPGLPPHSLVLRIGAVVRLMRNFSIDRGMVKNVRAVIQSLGQRLITVQLMNTVDGVSHIDPEVILIPRIRFDHIVHSGHTLHRRQFPLTLAYATTFNSCQGLTLDRIGVDLTRPVFSHGQLYTALSRIRNRRHGMVRLPQGKTCTTNVTYHEILN